MIANNSTGVLMLQFGIRGGVATVSGGVVTAVSVADAGFGFNCAPLVELLGGGNANDPATYGATMAGWPAPSDAATAVAVMSASSISGLQVASITVTHGGASYLTAPYVFLRPSRRDPTGVGLPSASVGVPLLPNGGSYYINGTACPTDAIAIFGGTTGQAFTCKWMP